MNLKTSLNLRFVIGNIIGKRIKLNIMGKKIKLNEEELRSVINEAIKNVLSEDNDINTNSRGETIALSSQFEDGLYTLEYMTKKLKGFITEYDIVVKSLLKYTKELGLELKDFSTEKYFDIEDAISGQVYDFDFYFVFPGVDTSSMTDEQYEEFQNKLYEIYNKFEYMIGNPSFGKLKMYVMDEGIQIGYSLKLINKE